MKNRDMTKEAKRLRAMRRGARLLRRTKKTAQKRHLGRKLALGAGRDCSL
jgi:hypothetical protein